MSSTAEASRVKSQKFCLGTWAWGAAETGPDQISAWAGTKDNTQADNQGAFEECVKQGVTFFDTAEIYNKGRSEESIAEFIKGANLDRTNILIATKFVPLPYSLFESSLRQALMGSLKRLQVDYIDLYQVHGPAYSVRSVETWAKALADVYKEGLIKEIGVSNYNSDQIKRTVEELDKSGLKLATNQIEYSLLHTFPEQSGLLKTCQEAGIKVLAYSPLAMGRLTGKIRDEASLGSMSGQRNFGACTWPQLEALLQVLDKIAEERKSTVSQISIAWVIAKGCIPIAGAKTAKQARDNCEAVRIELTEEEVKALDAVSISGKTSFWQGSSN